MAEAKLELVRLRAELVELRGQLAERDRLIGGLSDQVAVVVEGNAGLAERVAELERRLGANPGNCNRPLSREG